MPGVNTSYDMRGEGVLIRGFEADSNDIYRDGVRESGQVRRSTANVERIEILKGPASVLYGRGAGGGVVNMISRQARFDARSSVTLRGGSWQNYGGTLDLNHVVTGRFDTGGIRHDVLAGLEVSEEERHPRIGQPRTTFAYNPLLPIAWPAKQPQGKPSQHNLHQGEAQALYVQDLVTLTPHWKLLAGLRYDRFDFQSTNLLKNASRSTSGNAVSPRVGVVWQPVDAHSIYASWNKSFSPYGGRGLLSVSTTTGAVLDEEPQHSRQFEVGVKSDWLDGALSTQVAAYQLEHFNIRYRPDPDNDPFTWAVRGKERSRGVEFSAAGRLAPAWYVRGGVGLMSARVVGDRMVPANEGKRLRNTADRNGSLFLRHAPAGPWYAEIGLTHSSGRWIDAANTERLPGYTRWDALVGWRSGAWTATLAVSNLFDKQYWRSAAMPGTPRSFLLSANYQF